MAHIRGDMPDILGKNFWNFISTIERVGLRIDNIQKPLKLSYWPQAELDSPINSTVNLETFHTLSYKLSQNW